jgi:hypothetical protein
MELFPETAATVANAFDLVRTIASVKLRKHDLRLYDLRTDSCPIFIVKIKNCTIVSFIFTLTSRRTMESQASIPTVKPRKHQSDIYI